MAMLWMTHVTENDEIDGDDGDIDDDDDTHRDLAVGGVTVVCLELSLGPIEGVGQAHEYEKCPQTHI